MSDSPRGYRPWLDLLLFLCSIIAFSPATLAADERWPDERMAEPFFFHADFSLAGHENLLTETAQLQRDLADTLAVGPTAETIHLFLFARRGTYEEYLGTYFPKVPARRAIFIKERGPGMIFAYQSHEFDIDVRHESVHALLHASLPAVPLWLDEGLAEYFEVPAADRARKNPHLTSLRWEMRFGFVPKLTELEALDDVQQMGKTQYRQAWAWTHFLLHGPPEGHDELVRYLADLAARTPTLTLGDRLRRRLPDLDRRFVEHFRNW